MWPSREFVRYTYHKCSWEHDIESVSEFANSPTNSPHVRIRGARISVPCWRPQRRPCYPCVRTLSAFLSKSWGAIRPRCILFKSRSLRQFKSCHHYALNLHGEAEEPTALIMNEIHIFTLNVPKNLLQNRRIQKCLSMPKIMEGWVEQVSFEQHAHFSELHV